MKIFFFILIFIWFNPTNANTNIDFKNLLIKIKQNYENRKSLVSLLSKRLTTSTNTQAISNKEKSAISLVNTIFNSDYNNLFNKLYPDQSVLNLLLKSTQLNNQIKELLDNPETLITISLAVALNDSSILYSQQSLINSIEQIILKSLSNSNPTSGFNYSCLQNVVKQFFDYLIKSNGDYNQALNQIKQIILNCYSEQIITELNAFINLISTDLNKLVLNKTSIDNLLLEIGKYTTNALSLLVEILKNQISATTLPTTTAPMRSTSVTTRAVSTSTTTQSNSIFSKIISIKDEIISNLISGTKTPPNISDLVNIII